MQTKSNTICEDSSTDGSAILTHIRDKIDPGNTDAKPMCEVHVYVAFPVYQYLLECLEDQDSMLALLRSCWDDKAITEDQRKNAIRAIHKITIETIHTLEDNKENLH